jgi:hypothetical protein
MSTNDRRGGLKAAFTNFSKAGEEKEAELRLLGRAVEDPKPRQASDESSSGSYQVATTQPHSGGLTPRPLLQKEPVRQLSFRCPSSIAAELRRKAAFNQLEQQEIIIEGIKRVLSELPEPPQGWEI